MEQMENLDAEIKEELEDIENVLQMLELSLEMNEEEESVRRSIKIVRKMIHKLLVYAFGSHKQLIVEK